MRRPRGPGKGDGRQDCVCAGCGVVRGVMTRVPGVLKLLALSRRHEELDSEDAAVLLRTQAEKRKASVIASCVKARDAGPRQA